MRQKASASARLQRSIGIAPMDLSSLFTPVNIGPAKLRNRIIMAPLTRFRSAEPGDLPTELMQEYYRQRASAGLIISEATQISFEAKGSVGSPGLHTAEQIAAWREITGAVHAAGGAMAVQLWHTGRLSHSSAQPGCRAPGAPSAIAAEGTGVTIRDDRGIRVRVPTALPRALTIPEIRGVVRDFGVSAANARMAGFDLVELHGAHGYLIDQFFSPAANLRTDEYGGSVENRTRFALEVVDAATAAWSNDRIGFRIFPSGKGGGMTHGEERHEDILFLIRQLAKRELAYLHISEPDWAGGKPLSDAFRGAVREAFPGPIIAAGAYTPDKAVALISRGFIDAVAFGRLFIANPDLPERIAQDGPLNDLRPELNYTPGPEGYVDYPRLAQCS